MKVEMMRGIMAEQKTPRIKILPNGPYVVTGKVPLSQLIIEPKGKGYIFIPGRVFPDREDYSLCRCGKSKNMPFCDGSHFKEAFDGTETASQQPHLEQARKREGPGVDLTDVKDLCARAHFCNTDQGNVWELTRKSDDSELRDIAIKAAKECPSGRLIVWDKITGEGMEPTYEPSIVLIQDPSWGCSGPLWVRGGIPIEGSDGHEYEVRNRVTLCRCGESTNMPFCDATHLICQFQDGL